MENKLKQIGQFPVPGPEARKKKQMFVIKPSQTLEHLS